MTFINKELAQNIKTYSSNELIAEKKEFEKCCTEVGGLLLSFKTKELPSSIHEYDDEYINFAWHVWLARNKRGRND